MMKPGITVGMMLWNEAETLNRVLYSYKEIANEYVLGVDRKSNDGTQEIAKEWTDNYFEFDFNNNFSEIRNQILKRCNTKWFFQVDGHEFLVGESKRFLDELKEEKEKAELINVVLTIWGNEEPLFMFMAPRIFRTDREIIYERKIHNTLTCAPGGQDKFIKLEVKNDTGIILDHKQSVNRLLERQSQRNSISVPNLKGMIEKNDEAYDWFNLAVMLMVTGEQVEAVKAFNKAFVRCKREDIRYQIRLHLASIYRELRDDDKAKEVLGLALSNNALRNEHFIELARIYEKKNLISVAIRLYEIATTYLIPVSYLNIYLPYYSYFPYMKLFELYSGQGRLMEAKEVGEKLKTFKFFPFKEQLKSYLQKIGNVINSNKDKEEKETRRQ